MSLEGNSLKSSNSSTSDNSSDANIQNLLEQIDDYDIGDEEDWDSVVYCRPLNNSGTSQLAAETATGQTDGWYPFGKLENFGFSSYSEHHGYDDLAPLGHGS
ncbi:hypothetical protein DFH28DRAFT_952960 [Melampsora americana]|nr:hypothetical protein DFH28DRAFT_952960 [Melampsora americana]